MKPIRKCRECGLEAHSETDLLLFKKHHNGKYGYDQICLNCHNKQHKEYSKNNPEERTDAVRERESEYREKNRDRINAYHREHYSKNKEAYKKRIRRIISYKNKAVMLPVNPRKGFCSICGKTEQEEGKQLHMHHTEYDDSAPSKHIIEVCQNCHTKIHYNK